MCRGTKKVEKQKSIWLTCRGHPNTDVSIGSGIEPTTFTWWGSGARHWATSCAVLRKAASRVEEEKKTGPLGTRGPVRCRNTASIISNQAFSCAQSGPSHVARHAHFHFLPNTTTPCLAVSSPTFVCLYLWALMKINWNQNDFQLECCPSEVCQ